ncbi:glycosyltransferase [Sedimenticola selenatireducens]|uniref:glycosyltransferase n=1 Tax=Sedimenticola selenatireducens TaxID=191960 RepID=UPI00048F9A0B|nr:glycosyltransferase [Sedimenticola selenatireducens]
MSRNDPRVLLVEASGRGFLSHYSHALALGLQRAGIETQLLTGRRDELGDWAVPFHKQACLDGGWRGWRCVRRQVIETRPDIVHLQWVDNPFRALRFVRWAHKQGVRVVYTPHNILPHEKRWLLMPAYRLLYRMIDRVVARDAHLAWALEELLDTPGERLMLLPGSPNFLALQALECQADSPAPKKVAGERRLLFFGHGCRRKGLDRLLETVAGNHWPGTVHLVVAGEGVLGGISEALLDAASRAARITLIDRYVAPREVAALFRDADLLLMPYVKQCKSPLLDLAAALRLPVLRSDRVQGAEFREGIHGCTFAHDDHAAMERRLKQTRWLVGVRDRLAAMDDPLASIDRLAEDHRQLYLKVRSECLPGGEAYRLPAFPAPLSEV